MKRAVIPQLKQIYIKKIDKWVPSISDFVDDVEKFKKDFNNLISEEVKILKECSQKSIVDSYILYTKELLKSGQYDNLESIKDLLQIKARTRLAGIYTKNVTNDNIIDMYFNDVKREYIKHPMIQSSILNFNDDNRDIFIKNNLKLVVDCAKRYTNLGLPFEDLIQAGNYGLCIAFDRFDQNRSKLKGKILNDIENSELEEFTYNEAKEFITHNFSYDKNLEKTIKNLPKQGFKTKHEFIKWVNVNVKSAVFASVAFQWIRAMILYELGKNGKVIHVPNSAKKDKNNPLADVDIISLDSINPRTNDCYHDNDISEVANEEFIIEDENIHKIEHEANLSSIVNKLLYNLTNQERNIIKQRFGIGLPYSLSPSEIAENEGISVSKVKYHINNILVNMQKRLSEDERDAIIELLS